MTYSYHDKYCVYKTRATLSPAIPSCLALHDDNFLIRNYKDLFYYLFLIVVKIDVMEIVRDL